MFRFAHYECAWAGISYYNGIRSVCCKPFSDFTQVTVFFFVLNFKFPDNPNFWLVFSIRNLNQPWLVHNHPSLCTELCVFFLCCVSWQFCAVGRSGIECISATCGKLQITASTWSWTPSVTACCVVVQTPWTPSPCHSPDEPIYLRGFFASTMSEVSST